MTGNAGCGGWSGGCGSRSCGICWRLLFVIGVGLALRGRVRSAEDYFLSGRALPSWVTGLAFMAANLGALEIMGFGAGAARYGLRMAHFYWLGAIPAMVFVGLVKMRFHCTSKVCPRRARAALAHVSAGAGWVVVGRGRAGHARPCPDHPT